jgi:hypothetical protein
MSIQYFVGSEPTPGRMQKVINGDGDLTLSVKGIGGLWTCPNTSWFNMVTCEASQSYRASHEFHLWECVTRPDVRVWTINSLEDLQKLLTLYGRDVWLNRSTHPRDWLVHQEWLPKRNHSKLPPIHRKIKRFQAPDFEAMASDGWDGISLTYKGHHATQLAVPNLYGWDVQSVFWINAVNWPFKSVNIFMRQVAS